MSGNLGSQLESTKKRIYYLKFPDGHVEAFDSIESRDIVKDAKNGTIIHSSEFFNDVIESDPMAQDDALQVGGKRAEIDLKHTRAAL
jgi:hypothetical protein